MGVHKANMLSCKERIKAAALRQTEYGAKATVAEKTLANLFEKQQVLNIQQDRDEEQARIAIEKIKKRSVECQEKTDAMRLVAVDEAKVKAEGSELDSQASLTQALVRQGEENLAAKQAELEKIELMIDQDMQAFLAKRNTLLAEAAGAKMLLRNQADLWENKVKRCKETLDACQQEAKVKRFEQAEALAETKRAHEAMAQVSMQKVQDNENMSRMIYDWTEERSNRRDHLLRETNKLRLDRENMTVWDSKVAATTLERKEAATNHAAFNQFAQEQFAQLEEEQTKIAELRATLQRNAIVATHSTKTVQAGGAHARRPLVEERTVITQIRGLIHDVALPDIEQPSMSTVASIMSDIMRSADQG
jgi:uncharacterized protein YeaO (DUF488 family)